MKKGLLRSLVALLVVASTQATAFGWGSDGHRAIALTAQKRLGEHARAEIRRLLGNESMERVSTWPDELRSPDKLQDREEGLRFNQAFPRNGTWHYLNMPLGVKRYSPSAVGARPDDPVHVLRACIAVLRGQEAQGFDGLTPRHALTWLVHLAGDIHQPLHVGSGYYRQQENASTWTLITDPLQVAGLANDKGGNEVSLPLAQGRDTNLHRFWDTNLVKRIGRTPSAIAAALEGDLIPSRAKTRLDGLLQKKPAPETWATDTVHVAATAYARMDQVTFERNGNAWMAHPGLQRYEEYATPVAAQQLYKASMRLAATLNSIWP